MTILTNFNKLMVFIPNWAEYHNKIMFTQLGGFVGITELQWLIIIFQIFTGFAGQKYWLQMHGSFYLGNWLFCIYMSLGLFFLLVFTCTQLPKIKEKLTAFSHFIPIVVILISGIALLFHS